VKDKPCSQELHASE